jgi:hypothetical protein
VNVNGDTPQSAATTVTTGNATLSATNFNIIPAPGAFGTGVLAKKLIRTASAGTPNTTGLVAIIIAPQAVNDTGLVATAYTNPTVSPSLTGGAVLAVQIESTNPTQILLVCGTPRLLPGSLPQLGASQTGGFQNAGGYVGYYSLGATAIVSRSDACTTNSTATVTDASILTNDQGKPVSGTGIPVGTYVGTVTNGVSFLLSSSPTSQVNVLATATGSPTLVIGGSPVNTVAVAIGTPVPASVVAGAVVNLTGGANPTEAYYINAVNTTTGVIVLSTSPAVQAGIVSQAGHTSLAYGFASDADVNNLNTDIQAVVGEFPTTAQYVNLDGAINANISHMFQDGTHLNDRGDGIGAGTVAQVLGQICSGLQPYQLAAHGRGRRRPEEFQVFRRDQRSVPAIGDVTLTSVSWANVTDSGSAIVANYVAAKAGDWVELDLSALVANQSSWVYLDAATINNAGAVINYVSTRCSTPYLGVGGWTAIGGVYTTIGGRFRYQITPADLVNTSLVVNGAVFFYLRYQLSTAVNHTLYMSSWPFEFLVRNLGQQSYFAGNP